MESLLILETPIQTEQVNLPEDNMWHYGKNQPQPSQHQLFTTRSLHPVKTYPMPAETVPNVPSPQLLSMDCRSIAVLHLIPLPAFRSQQAPRYEFPG